jgi:DNA repair exonuclease SbcCD ATPase subunit
MPWFNKYSPDEVMAELQKYKNEVNNVISTINNNISQIENDKFNNYDTQLEEINKDIEFLSSCNRYLLDSNQFELPIMYEAFSKATNEQLIHMTTKGEINGSKTKDDLIYAVLKTIYRKAHEDEGWDDEYLQDMAKTFNIPKPVMQHIEANYDSFSNEWAAFYGSTSIFK